MKDNRLGEVMLSVVVPCFNQADFLPQCLASVARATVYPHQVVVVDDGSDDPVDEVLPEGNELGRLHQELTIVRQDNRGLANARNHGLALARAPYVKFLDADDMLWPGSLDIMVQALERTSADIGLGGYLLSDAAGLTGELPLTQPFEYSLQQWSEIPGRWEVEISIPIHSALFRRDTLLSGFVDGLRSKEDWVFWSSCVTRGLSTTVTKELVAIYRIHGRNMTRSRTALAAIEWLEAFRLVFTSIGIEEERVRVLSQHFVQTYLKPLSGAEARKLHHCVAQNPNASTALALLHLANTGG